jgi:predicted amidophosphoribosyltransferase
MRCPVCGSKLSSLSRYCPNCGSDADNRTENYAHSRDGDWLLVEDGDENGLIIHHHSEENPY